MYTKLVILYIFGLNCLSHSVDTCGSSCYTTVNNVILTDTCCEDDGISFVGYMKRNHTPSTYGNTYALSDSTDIVSNIILIQPLLAPPDVTKEYKFIIGILETINNGTTVEIQALPQFNASTVDGVNNQVETIASSSNYTTLSLIRIPINTIPASYTADATSFVLSMYELGLSGDYIAIRLVTVDTDPPSDIYVTTGYTLAEIEIIEDTDPTSSEFPIWAIVIISVVGCICVIAVIYLTKLNVRIPDVSLPDVSLPNIPSFIPQSRGSV